MIQRFSDHAANERTFLAWVRTAIAVMAFGFLVERFDLFMDRTAPALGGGHHLVGSAMGLLLILLGSGMLALSTLRFRRTARHIDDPEIHPGTGARTDLALAGLLVMLGAALAAYLAYAVLRRP